jgi:MYXO-CTERM domain-containing protein
MVKRFRLLALAGALTLGVGAVALPRMLPAQTTDPRATTADVDDGGDWGWIGLFGLAGLAGLMRRSTVDHPVTRPNPATR